jgi:sugar lactone lactonase YvrE
MPRFCAAAIVLTQVLLTACGGSNNSTPPPDSSADAHAGVDARSIDAASADATAIDATSVDTAATDATQTATDAIQGDAGPQPQLSLLAGQLGGLGTIDGTAMGARFEGAEDVASDGAGNLYITDFNASTIRKLVLATGVVTTFAGTPGVTGSADGMGPAASFNQPAGIVADGVGNLFVSDYGNQTIRQIVVATGAVTTIAGTAGMAGSTDAIGAAARFSGPTGLAMDGPTVLFVADNTTDVIRQIALSTDTVTTIAGSPGASGTCDGTGSGAAFEHPWGLIYGVSTACPTPGCLYIADNQGETVRMLALSSDAVTTIAGMPGATGNTDGVGAAAGFNGPLELALDGSGLNLLVSDSFNDTIRQVALQTNTVTTLAGSAGLHGTTDGVGINARFFYPQGLATDGSGNLDVADTLNGEIRQIGTTGVVTTVAGAAPRIGSADATGAAASFNQQWAVTSDGAGHLFVADAGNNTIRQIDLATGAVSTFAGQAGVKGSADGTGTAATFNFPQGLTFDGAGHLFVADTANDTIREIVITSRAVTTLAGTAGMVGNTDAAGAAARFNVPVAITSDGAGNLLVADTGNRSIREVIVASGAVTKVVGPVGGGGVGPLGIATDGKGNVFFSQTAQNFIRVLNLNTKAVTALAGTNGKIGSADGTGVSALFNYPEGLWYDGAGNLYVADTGNSTIRKIVVATAAVTTVVGVAGSQGVRVGPLPGSINQPHAVGVLPGGGLAISDSENAILLAQ